MNGFMIMTASFDTAPIYYVLLEQLALTEQNAWRDQDSRAL